MRSPVIFVFAILAVICGACQREHSHSGSSTAVLDADGTVRARKATPRELADVEDIERKGAAVDKLFPRPEPPTNESYSKGVRVVAPNAVELTDGRLIRLDGIRCSPIGLDYLSRFLLRPDASLIIVPTGAAQDRIVPADVWSVDRRGTALMYSFPAEAAITNGWCDPERTSTGKHAERYEALATAFSEDRAKFSGKHANNRWRRPG